MIFPKYIFKLALILITYILPIQNFSQENSTKILTNEFSKKLSAELSPYYLGSGFTFILFRYTQEDRYDQISTISSNFKSKEIINKSIAESSSFFKIENINPGYFALPIIQIMFDDNKNDNDKSNDLNWSNNHSWEMMSFNLLSKIPEKIILLKPIIIMGSPPISKNGVL
jgi:hypothetical protein